MLQFVSSLLGAILSEDLFNAIKFFVFNRRLPDFRQPKEFHEKVLWLKMNERNRLMTRCADKYGVRGYVADAVGEDHLIPLLGVHDSADSIDFSILPERFVIKATHGSGWNIIVTEKSRADLRRVRRRAGGFLRRNFYHRSQEWQYKNIKPRLIVEEYLSGPDGEVPWDYKFFCFDRGRNPDVFVQVDMGRFGDYQQVIMTGEWQPAGFRFRVKKTRPPDRLPPRPPHLDEMVRMARILAKDHNFCRVDLYLVCDRLYFGELTFHPYAGFRAIRPVEASLRLGSMIELAGSHPVENPIA